MDLLDFISIILYFVWVGFMTFLCVVCILSFAGVL